MSYLSCLCVSLAVHGTVHHGHTLSYSHHANTSLKPCPEAPQALQCQKHCKSLEWSLGMRLYTCNYMHLQFPLSVRGHQTLVCPEAWVPSSPASPRTCPGGTCWGGLASPLGGEGHGSRWERAYPKGSFPGSRSPRERHHSSIHQRRSRI